MKAFEFCKGCANLMEAVQVSHFDTDGVTRLEKPREVVIPYCDAYEMHLVWVARVLKNLNIKDRCPKYWEGWEH